MGSHEERWAMYERTRASGGTVAAPGIHRRFSIALRVLAATALTTVALGATAATTLGYGVAVACTGRTMAQVFAPWGDTGSYFQVLNGGFENGADGWALSGGAQVVAENEPYRVAGASDSSSLQLPPGSTAESRTMCVSTGEDTVRFFVKNEHVPGSILHVDAVVRNPTLGSIGYAAFDVNGDVPSDEWSPTMELQIPWLIKFRATEELTLFFSLRGAPATWQIDDIHIDPFKSW
jgi:hypothetical protein